MLEKVTQLHDSHLIADSAWTNGVFVGEANGGDVKK